MSMTFDSTHFADGTTLTITVKATNSLGETGQASYSAPAYNKAYVLGNDLLDGGQLSWGRYAVSFASARLGEMSHSMTRQSTTDNKATILSNLTAPTVFYIWTHGIDIPSSFGDCFAYGNSPDTFYVFASNDPTGASNVTAAVGGKTATQPPYNFIFLDACLTGQNGSMPGAFGITTSSSNRSYLGYTTLSDDSQHNANWSNRVLTNLRNGQTIDEAVRNADVVGTPQLNGQRAYTYIWGDSQMKLHGVYGGVGTEWFR